MRPAVGFVRARQPPKDLLIESEFTMTKVKMVARISGTRNGEDWPAPGEVADVSADEAAALIAAGLASAAGGSKEAAAVDVSEVETAAVKPARGRKA